MIWAQMILMGSAFGALSLWAILRSKKVKAGSVSLPVFALVCGGLAVLIGMGTDLA